MYTTMLKSIKYVLVLLLAVHGFNVSAQFQDPEYAKKAMEWYPEIDKEKFRYISPVMEEGFMEDYKAYGEGVDAGKASSKKVEIDGFDNVIEVETHDVFHNDWDVEVGAPNDHVILQHDVIYITFWIRTLESRDESNQAFARVYLQQNGSPWLKSKDVNVVAGSDWVQYRIPFHAQFQNYKPEEAAVAFALGQSHQTVQIADMRISNFGDGTNFKDDWLPGTKFTYESRDPDAAWRSKAEERIEKYRKGDLKVVVKDREGNPVPDVKVSVDMQNHNFGFGNIVSMKAFLNPGPNGKKYREIIKNNFNEVTFENANKYNGWNLIKDEGQLDRFMQVVDSLRSWDVDIRGHVLVWPDEKYTDVSNLIDDPDALRKELRSHIEEITTEMKGKLVDWDVVNEPYVNHQFMDILGKEEFLEWFRIAEENDPDVDFYINETRFMVDKGVNKNVQDNLYDWATYVLDNDLKLDGLGFQGHFGETGLTEMPKLMELWDRFAELDLKIKITELDIQTHDEKLQADYMRDLYTIAYSHPALHAIISWGFWERAHWRAECAWYKDDWTVKPIAEVHKELVYDKWWTNESGNTATDGTFTVNGFEGDYTVTIEKDGKTETKKVNLTNKGNSIEVTLN